MAISPTAISLPSPSALNGVPALSVGIPAIMRNINGLVPMVTVEERHSDRMTVTSHPVEQGAKISDHIFREPAELTLIIGWSNSSNTARRVAEGGNDTLYVNAIEQKLRKMMWAGEKIKVATGKRTYENMVIVGFSHTTTSETENAIVFNVDLQEILTATTQTVALPNATVQAEPDVTAPPVEQGQKQAVQSTDPVPDPTISAADPRNPANGFSDGF